MIIDSIAFNNYKVYKDTKIEFERNGCINLLFGQNGFGKTSLLNAILWCLYGSKIKTVDPSISREIRNAGGYKNYLSSLITWEKRQEDDPHVSVSISFSGVKNAELGSVNTIQITRHFSGIDLKDKVEIMIDHSPLSLDMGMANNSSKIDDLKPELFIEKYVLPSELARLFLFDSEKIVQIGNIGRKGSDKFFLKVFHHILNINSFINIKDALIKKRDDILLYRFNEDNKKQVQELRELKSSYEEEVSSLNSTLEGLESSKEDTEDLVFDLQNELLRQTSFLNNEDLEQIESEINDARERIKNIQELIKNEALVLPIVLFESLLVNIRDKAYSPKNNKIEEGVLISIKDAIEPLILKSRRSDFKIIIDSYKSNEQGTDGINFDNIRRTFDSIDKSGSTIHLLIKELKDAKSRLLKIEKTKKEFAVKDSKKAEKIRVTIENHRGDLKKISENITKTRIALDACQSKLITTNKKVDTLIQSIELENSLEGKVEKISKKIDDISAFIEIWMDKCLIEYEKEINSLIESLYHKDDTFFKCKVINDGDSISIELFNLKGKRLSIEDLSMGERQILSLAMLKTLISQSDISFPLIVDSPFQKLDSQHSTAIIGKLLSEISDQVILLPIKGSEINRSMFKQLEPMLSGTYEIVNNHGLSLIEKLESNQVINSLNV